MGASRLAARGLDAMLAVLDALPRFEVRLVNPFARRRYRLLDFATDFSRVNRLMHHTSMTADHQATIVGGRNVGDEYFGASAGVELRSATSTRSPARRSSPG